MRRSPFFGGVPLAMWLVSACTPADMEVPATEVILVVDGTSDVRTRSDSIQVAISGSDSRDGPFADPLILMYGPPASRIGFPRHIALVPQMGDSKRFFEITATASSGGTMVASTLVRSGYLVHQTLQLRIVLDDSCRPISCPIGQTCRHGVCQDVFIDPGMLPTVDGGMPVDAGGTDAGVPDGASDGPVDFGFLDGGPPDASGDAGCPNDAACDDHDPCDGIERCVAGACIGDARRVFCDDGVSCTVDTCATATGCMHAPSDAACTLLAGGHCDPTSDCQYPTCTGATCMADPSMCMTASCSGATCNRASTCATGQACCSGTCDTPGCDDGNPCTDDSCGTTGCVHAANAAACSDGNLCTAPDLCGGGICHGGPTMSCDDFNPCTADSCSSGACVHAIDNTAPCNDGDECSYGDHCLGGDCHGTIIIDACDDSNVCTLDDCDHVTGMCTHAAATVGTFCDDPDSCYTGGHCAGTSCVGGTGCSGATPFCCPLGGCATSGVSCP